MSEQLLISQDYGAPLTMEDLEVGHTAGELCFRHAPAFQAAGRE